jgi:hypothetical protein
MRIEIADHVTWYRLGDRAIVIDRRKRTRSGLGEASALLWQHLARGADEGALRDTLAEHCGVPEDEAGALVREFIASLVAKQLVFVRESAA